jgi:hypothetical protein
MQPVPLNPRMFTTAERLKFMTRASDIQQLWPALLCNVKQRDDKRIYKLQRVEDEAEVASFEILSGTCLEGLRKTMKSLGEDS